MLYSDYARFYEGLYVEGLVYKTTQENDK